MTYINSQVLIQTRVGKYVWYPSLEIIEFYEKGKRRAHHTLYCPVSKSELDAMIMATNDMLKLLKEAKKERING